MNNGRDWRHGHMVAQRGVPTDLLTLLLPRCSRLPGRQFDRPLLIVQLHRRHPQQIQTPLALPRELRDSLVGASGARGQAGSGHSRSRASSDCSTTAPASRRGVLPSESMDAWPPARWQGRDELILVIRSPERRRRVPTCS
jgi:hypothetical protein